VFSKDFTMAGLQTLVFLLFGVAFVCAGVTRSSVDVASFRAFLQRSVDGRYQEPLTPELAELQNEWERSGKFEGDIVLTPEQMDSFVEDYAGSRNAILDTRKLWTNKVLYYQTTGLTTAQVTAVETALAAISAASCVKFQKRTTANANYVNVVVSNTGCYSSVGMVGGAQTLNLQTNTPGNGCFRHGTIIHEFLHALGFYHMQSTHNRDDFVRIVWDKIQAGTENNFNKYTSSQVTNFNVLYDYGSVLHYSEYGFSTDGSKTIVPLQSTSADIGQRVGMSAGDISKLKSQYSC